MISVRSVLLSVVFAASLAACNDPEERVATYMQRGVQQFEAGKYEAAAKALVEAAALPGDPHERAQAAMNAGVMFEKAKSDTAQAEVQHALDGFQGFSAFAYGSLFETPNDAVDRPDAASRAERDALRKAVLPWLRAAKPSTAR